MTTGFTTSLITMQRITNAADVDAAEYNTNARLPVTVVLGQYPSIVVLYLSDDAAWALADGILKALPQEVLAAHAWTPIDDLPIDEPGSVADVHPGCTNPDAHKHYQPCPTCSNHLLLPSERSIGKCITCQTVAERQEWSASMATQVDDAGASDPESEYVTSE
jgi:hypothetical protein